MKLKKNISSRPPYTYFEKHLGMAGSGSTRKNDIK